MTTVFADAKARTMVSDSLMRAGNTACRVTKVMRINGSLIGVAGDLTSALLWIESFRNGAPPPECNEDSEFDALVLTPAGDLHLYSCGRVPILLEQAFYAIGSGAQAALGAWRGMELVGFTPNAALAVEASCSVDLGSGGPIQVFRLDEDKPVRSRGKAKS